MKSNHLKFNTSIIIVELNDYVLENPAYVKYLGIIIDDKLFFGNSKMHMYLKNIVNALACLENLLIIYLIIF